MNLHLTDPANIGGRIKHMREQRGMTQPELAEAIGIKQPSMSDIESGKSKSPSAINLLKIAHAWTRTLGGWQPARASRPRWPRRSSASGQNYLHHCPKESGGL